MEEYVEEAQVFRAEIDDNGEVEKVAQVEGVCAPCAVVGVRGDWWSARRHSPGVAAFATSSVAGLSRKFKRLLHHMLRRSCQIGDDIAAVLAKSRLLVTWFSSLSFRFNELIEDSHCGEV